MPASVTRSRQRCGDVDGRIRYEMVSGLQADVRAVAEAERLARMARDHRPRRATRVGGRSRRSAALPVPGMTGAPRRLVEAISEERAILSSVIGNLQ